MDIVLNQFLRTYAIPIGECISTPIREFIFAEDCDQHRNSQLVNRKRIRNHRVLSPKQGIYIHNYLPQGWGTLEEEMVVGL